jgi:hypothetical protein
MGAVNVCRLNLVYQISMFSKVLCEEKMCCVIVIFRSFVKVEAMTGIRTGGPQSKKEKKRGLTL